MISMNFTTVNGTGTGEILVGIHPPDDLHIPFGQTVLMDPQQPGSYGGQWNVIAEPDPNCDPATFPCEMWSPGNYTVKLGKYLTSQFPICSTVCLDTLRTLTLILWVLIVKI